MMISVIAALALTLAAPQEGWVASYQAYDAALAANDQEAAIRHAREAWQQSREVLPASENRALLAQNYANLVVISDPDEAIAPLKDAVEMAEQGFGVSNYSVEALKFLLAGATSASRPENGRAVMNTYRAWKELSIDDRWDPAFLSIQRSLIKQLYVVRKIEEATEVASNLALDSERFDQLPFAFRNDVVTIWMGSLLQLQPVRNLRALMASRESVKELRMRNEFADYRDDLVEAGVVARGLFFERERAESIADTPQDLARLRAWLFITQSFYLTFSGTHEEWRERVGSLPTLTIEPRECRGISIPWESREVEYELKGSKAWNGVVTAAYDLTEAGEVTNVRIVTEIPAERFRNNVLRATKNWKVGDISGLPSSCFQDRLVDVIFVVEL